VHAHLQGKSLPVVVFVFLCPAPSLPVEGKCCKYILASALLHCSV